MDANAESEKLRTEAKRLLNSLLRIPEGSSNGMSERLIDCIIGATILQIAHLTTASTGQPEKPYAS